MFERGRLDHLGFKDTVAARTTLRDRVVAVDRPAVRSAASIHALGPVHDPDEAEGEVSCSIELRPLPCADRKRRRHRCGSPGRRPYCTRQANVRGPP